MIGIHHGTAQAFADAIIDNFEEMLEQCEAQPLVYGISLHAFIVGQPFRLIHLRRALQVVAKHNDRVCWRRPAPSPLIMPA
jgi:allantoinase